jgi:hypothetical protein
MSLSMAFGAAGYVRWCEAKGEMVVYDEFISYLKRHTRAMRCTVIAQGWE